jgi:site-specific recombinase XerD
METTAIATQSNEYLIIQNVPAVLTSDVLDNVTNVFLSFQQINHNTPATYKRALRQFFGWVGQTGRTIANLTRADLLAYIQDMRAREMSPNTINSYLTAIRRFYEFCDLYNVAPNIAKGIKGVPTTSAEEHEKSDFTPTQAANILTAAEGNKRDHAIMMLMMICGLRTIEIVRANIGDIELMGDTYVLTVHGKRDKKRRVPIPSETWAAVNAYLFTERRGAKNNDPLFASNGHQCKGDRLTTRSVSRIAKNNIRAVGINDSRHTAHSCRHTALGCIVSEQNPDTNKMQTAQTLAGHSDPNTTWIYVKQQAQRDFLRSAPNKIVEHIILGV